MDSANKMDAEETLLETNSFSPKVCSSISREKTLVALTHRAPWLLAIVLGIGISTLELATANLRYSQAPE